MKKLWLLLSVIVLGFALVSCGGDDKDKDPNPNGGEKQLDVELADTFKSFAKNKEVYLTTVGQADIDIVQNILENAAGLVEDQDFIRNHELTAYQVPFGSVVFLVTGTSSKGLGAASTDVQAEKNRATAFVNKANAGQISIVLLHVGGEARRGSLTDPILNVACPGADLMLVVADGDQDNLFTNFSKNNNIPLYLFSKATKMVPAFAKLFE